MVFWPGHHAVDNELSGVARSIDECSRGSSGAAAPEQCRDNPPSISNERHARGCEEATRDDYADREQSSVIERPDQDVGGEQEHRAQAYRSEEHQDLDAAGVSPDSAV